MLKEPHCRDIHHVQDQCAFFNQYCGEEDDGILSYLNLYYCRLSGAKPLAMILNLSWLAILFTTLGVVAGDFFSVNLSTIAHALHMSDTLAGVTFLALGNGSPDIFSTFAAINSNSSSMAIGELVGAAAFITSVVAGSMALVKPFHVVKVSLIRDCLSLIIVLVFLICVMVDGFLRLWHCIVMLIFYVVYVASVMGWHWWLSHKANAKDGAEEGHVQIEGNTHSPSTEETPLLPKARSEYSGHKARGHLEVSRRRRKPGFWQYWAEGPHHKVDYRAINPSIMSTLQFRHHESIERQRYAREAFGTNGQDGHSQILSEGQQTHSLEARETTSPVTKARRSLGHVFQVMFPSLQDLRTNNVFYGFTKVIIALITLVVKLTIPVVDDDSEHEDMDGKHKEQQSSGDWERWLLMIQGLIAPQFLSAIIWHQLSVDPSKLLLPALVCLGGSAVFALIVLLASDSTKKPRWYPFISIAGFVVSIAWISTVADEMVSVLEALGIISNISEAVLGLTVFAVGNSLDDLAANISVTQHRHPVMALSACFGGPLLLERLQHCFALVLI
ncbi:MAG: hypothetical protein ALECFALPRED_009544 [Alectoria fallacina]|uniref:Sodium/calcium exchanger membrane region domain-containing protein n=1 Tax=Alectoria fallacina TaxID=1903189 RepID=A0A8H3J7A8_9LECA|nr:MAG: hypothetical protein ALECFALPRED_009544 [Alectoria fallacina]